MDNTRVPLLVVIFFHHLSRCFPLMRYGNKETLRILNG